MIRATVNEQLAVLLEVNESTRAAAVVLRSQAAEVRLEARSLVVERRLLAGTAQPPQTDVTVFVLPRPRDKYAVAATG
jgi:hypothetical protein